MQIKKFSTILAFSFFVLPVSTTYELHDFGFGSGGVDISSSPTYSIGGVSGEVSGQPESGTLYDLGPGLVFTRQSNTPAAPTFTNPANHYNKLKFTLDTGGNPTDTLFAIAISTDNFATTNFIQTDNTVGTNPAYQTYSAWGGASGAFAIGLAQNTTYKIKVKAVQTKYTESSYSAVATASTVAPSLSYDLDISATDQETSPPYTVSFGTLSVGSVTTATNLIWVDLETNAENGGFVYLYNSSAGLASASAAYTITSTSTNLTSANEGYGLRVASATQISGGPLTAVAPYNGVSENVGILDTTTRNIFTSATAPIVGGRGSVYVKAKASTTTPSASDYTSVITMIASATF